MKEEQRIEMPEDFQQVGRDLAEVAKKHNLISMSGEFIPRGFSNFGSKIEFAWDSGRHGDNASRIILYAKMRVETEISTESNQGKVTGDTKILMG